MVKIRCDSDAVTVYRNTRILVTLYWQSQLALVTYDCDIESMRIPWRREQPIEEQPSSQPSSEQQASDSLWRATKDALQTHLATVQANVISTKDTLQDHTTSIKDRLTTKAYTLASRPASYLVFSGFVLGSVSTLGAAFVYRRCFRRLKTSEWVTPDILGRRRWVKGIVTK